MMTKLNVATSLLALAMVTACTNRAEKPVAPAINGDTAVTEPPPPPNIIPEPAVDAGTTSATTTSDTAAATATTDAMSGVEPKQETVAPKAKAHRSTNSSKMKTKKSTKTETTTTKSNEVGAVSPIYDSTDVTSESGTTTSATLPPSSEISTPMVGEFSSVPGRMASALTDWGVTYRINDAKAASAE